LIILRLSPFLLAISLLLLAAGTPEASAYSNEPKLILIHLDSASSFYLEEEMEKGNLPNLEAYFQEHNRIKYAITYFPSKTPTVISSIRQGKSLEESILPGWKRTDQDNGGTVGMITTFLNMAFSKSRIATTNLIYGLPAFYWMAPPALVNTADYLKDYNILEFYWYRVDSEGHFRGEESYRRELAIFDRNFGRLVRRLDDDVNIIIYSDHGMTFGEGIEIDGSIDDVVGEDLAIYSYPTVFLNDPGKAGYYARKLIKETELDFTFYREDEMNRVVGIHEVGTIYFTNNGEGVRYEYETADVLGYYKFGYAGEYWDMDQWIEFSHALIYPAAPPSLYYFLQNPNSGDIVTLFEENRFPRTGYSREGNHGGFTRQDMVTPLFVRGPEIDELYGLNHFWLPDLFNRIEGIDFNQQPPRERHYVATRYNFRRDQQIIQASFSPGYRIHYGANFYLENRIGTQGLERTDVWGKADIFRSYLTRAWIGTGIEIRDSEITPFLKFQYDIHLRRFVLQNSLATNRQYYFKLSWEVRPWLALETVNFNSLGVRFDF
jgi:hypothetical protein